MRNLSEDYVNGSRAKVRDIYVKLMLNDEEDTVFDMQKLLPISVNRSITDGSFGVGFASSDRLVFSVAAADKIAKRTRTTLYASYSKTGTYERLGRFYCETSRRNGNVVNVTAFDAMNILRGRTVKFTGIPSKEIPELVFPCKMQDVLDYIVIKNGLTCNFICEDFTIQKKPMKNETEYYSDSEILGYIASAHAKNAKFNYEGELVFVGYTSVASQFTASNVIDISIDDSEPFEVTGILFKVGDDSIYIDDTEGSEYDEEAEGVIKIENPFASVEVAEFVWNQLGGLKYYGGSITIRGAGIYECGDVITVTNMKNLSDKNEYPLCITSIDYSIGEDGFTETLSSRISKSEGKSLSSGGGSSSSGGKNYYAGQGLTLTADNAFKLNIANQGDIGGLRIAGTESVLDGDVTADLGVYKTPEAFPALRTALRHQKGGFFLGDGFVPVLEEYEDNGETKYRVTDYVQLRLGDGLCFTDNDEEATDVKELRENSLGGRRLSVVKATKELFGTVRPGYGLLIDSEGNLRTIYTSGNGIDISTTGEIAVKYDNKTIKLNENEELEASGGLTVENGIIIQEADAEYLLHEYEVVEYIQGNKLVYGAQPNPIIIGSYPADSALYRSETGYDPTGSAVYQDMTFKGLAGTATTAYEDYRLYLSVTSLGATSSKIRVYDSNGAAKGNARTTYDLTRSGFNFEWTAIHASTDVYPYGYADVTVRVLNVESTGALVSGVYFTITVGFVSEAEYNYACGITYEPNTLTQVNETVTEV